MKTEKEVNLEKEVFRLIHNRQLKEKQNNS